MKIDKQFIKKNYIILRKIIRFLIFKLSFIKKLRFRYFYFLWQRYKYPEIFRTKMTENFTVEDAIRAADYSVVNVNWFIRKCDYTLRLNYPLDADSIVFDIGGYIGDWAKNIQEKYNCYMYIFEPNPESFTVLKKKFENEPKIKTFSFGLADADTEALLSMQEMGSSVYSYSDNKILVQLRDVKQIIDELGIRQIDLIKINIEGGEYALLQRMIETEIVKKCKDIQIQFHKWYPDARLLRKNIRRFLSLTHYLTYDFSFVWENWRRRGDAELKRITI